MQIYRIKKFIIKKLIEWKKFLSWTKILIKIKTRDKKVCVGGGEEGVQFSGVNFSGVNFPGGNFPRTVRTTTHGELAGH